MIEEAIEPEICDAKEYNEYIKKNKRINMQNNANSILKGIIWTRDEYGYLLLEVWKVMRLSKE